MCCSGSIFCLSACTCCVDGFYFLNVHLIIVLVLDCLSAFCSFFEEVSSAVVVSLVCVFSCLPIQKFACFFLIEYFNVVMLIFFRLSKCLFFRCSCWFW